jgi:nucleotide-binding universal stress UspA family protein
MNTSTDQKETGLVVVGIDGSEESITALQWAIEEARIRGARVRAMNVWTYPVGYGMEMAAINVLDSETIEQTARAVLDQAVEKALIGVDEPPLVERVIRQGSPSKELLAEAKGADLLVVGQRGHGGFLGLLLGSVANQVLHHATCPAVMIPRARVTT